MPDIEFIEKATELGIDITEPEARIIAEEMKLLGESMVVTKTVFKLKLENLIAGLEARKMSSEQVINVLLDDLDNNGVIFGGLKRQLIGNAEGMTEELSSQLDNEIMFQESGQEQMTWVAILANTCEDCVARHGFTKTYAEWQAIGLPKTGFSVCTWHCKCQLFPASVMESKEELRLPLKRAKGKLTQIAKEKKADGKIKNVKKYVNRNLGTIHNTKAPNRKQILKVLPKFKL